MAQRKRMHPGATPSRGGYRAQVVDPATGQKLSANKVLGLKPTVYQARGEASEVCWRAERLLEERPGADGNLTVDQARTRWLGKGWPKESTAKVNAQRTRRFCDRHAGHPIALVTEELVIADRAQHVIAANEIEGLKAMFNWCASADGGRLVAGNPFSIFKSKSVRGNRRKNPPSVAQTDRLILEAWAETPFYGAWIETATVVGARPGELDAARWEDFSPDLSEWRIRRQWNHHTNTVTLPKNGLERTVTVPPRARRALERLNVPRDGYVFLNTQGDHFRPTSRQWYWSRVRDRAGLGEKQGNGRYQYSLYLCTRHYAGWFMVNELEMDSEDVAFQLGHEDNGKLVRELYGHRERQRGLRRIAAAFDAHDQAA